MSGLAWRVQMQGLKGPETHIFFGDAGDTGPTIPLGDRPRVLRAPEPCSPESPHAPLVPAKEPTAAPPAPLPIATPAVAPLRPVEIAGTRVYMLIADEGSLCRRMRVVDVFLDPAAAQAARDKAQARADALQAAVEVVWGCYEETIRDGHSAEMEMNYLQGAMALLSCNEHDPSWRADNGNETTYEIIFGDLR